MGKGAKNRATAQRTVSPRFFTRFPNSHLTPLSERLEQAFIDRRYFPRSGFVSGSRCEMRKNSRLRAIANSRARDDTDPEQGGKTFYPGCYT